jgi:hypothetical protein
MLDSQSVGGRVDYQKWKSSSQPPASQAQCRKCPRDITTHSTGAEISLITLVIAGQFFGNTNAEIVLVDVGD